MAKASPEIIKISEDYTKYATNRLADKVRDCAVDDEVSSFTCFHTSPKPPNRDIQSFYENMLNYVKTGAIADAYDFDSDGWVVGDVAWVISMLTGECPDGTLLNVRTTTILRNVDGEWKVAHLHLSEPVVCSQHMTPKAKKED